MSKQLCSQHGFQQSPLTNSVFLPLYLLSLPPKKSEKRVLCGPIEVKMQENAARWIHTGPNPAVSSASAVVSSCTEPLAALSM